MLRTRTIAVVVSLVVSAAVAVGGVAALPDRRAQAVQSLEVQSVPLSGYNGGRSILINELSNGDSESDAHGFIELRNWGNQPVDLTGWNLFRCSESGLRSN